MIPPRHPPHAPLADHAKLPWLFSAVIGLTFLPWVTSGSVYGFSISGWSWLLALAASLLVLVSTPPGRIVFPFWYWAMWVLLLIVYRFFMGNHPDSLQTLLQTLTPIFVGCAISTFRTTPAHLELVYSWLTRLFYVALVLVVAKNTAILLGKLPVHGKMTPEAISCCMLASFYISFYSTGSPRHLWFYLGMLAVPAILLVRGPLLSASSAFFLTPSPLRLRQRILFGAALALFGLMLFYSPRYQNLMFHSGEGTIQDLRWDNDNLQTSGRKAMWEALWDNWKKAPWTGHGLNASRTTLLDAGYSLYLPHNDWLKLLHDVGIIGVVCFGATMCLQMLALIALAHKMKGTARSLAFAAASAFVPFAVVMVTDNVTLYVQYYSNLHFALIGIVYSFARNWHPDPGRPPAQPEHRRAAEALGRLSPPRGTME